MEELKEIIYAVFALGFFALIGILFIHIGYELAEYVSGVFGV
jgi:hypothetical protein